jgi:hypothetical protein
MTHPDPARWMNVVLMADPRVTAIQVIDNSEALVDVRDSDLPVSS